MWGAVGAVLGAAVVLALGQTFIEGLGKQVSDSASPQKGVPQLPEPDEKLKGSASKSWTAPLWKEGGETLERARKLSGKVKR